MPNSHILTRSELRALGFRHCGDSVKIDRSVRFFGCHNIWIGENVRIDCFAMLSAGPDGITIGNHVHVGAGAYVFGASGPILMEDFSGLSSRVALYTSTDDFTEGGMAHPTVPEAYRNVNSGPITLRRHVIVGAGSVVLPGVELAWGSTVGALSLVKISTQECDVVAGVPAKPLRKRRDGRRLRAMEERYIREMGGGATHD